MKSFHLSPLFLVVLFFVPQFSFAQAVQFAEYCDSYQSIAALSDTAVSGQGSECQLELEAGGKSISLKAQINDFTGDKSDIDNRYVEYERGIDGFLGACVGAEHPCEIDSERDGHLVSNVIRYDVPDNEGGDLFLFTWGAGEIAASVDEYRDHVYSLFVSQSDQDHEVDSPGLYRTVVSHTRAIIDSRIEQGLTLGTAGDGAADENTTQGDAPDKIASDQSNEDGDEAEEDSRELKILAIGEDVEVRRAGRDWQEATPDTTLSDGDEISTGPDSTLTLQFPDGSIMKVGELSQVRVGFLLDRENAVRAQVALNIGKVSARVNPKKTSFTDFTIKSPIATASVRGTVFSVIYHSNTGMRVMVQEGEVEVASVAGESQTVRSGNEVRVREEGFNDQTPFLDSIFETGEPGFDATAGGGGTAAATPSSSGNFGVLLVIVIVAVIAGVVILVVKRTIAHHTPIR